MLICLIDMSVVLSYYSVFQFSYIFLPVHLHLLACILILVACICLSCFSNFVTRMNLNLLVQMFSDF